MRLFNAKTLRMQEFFEPEIPPYIILSHRWELDQEVTFQDIEQGQANRKRGYHKIEKLCEIAISHEVEWFWLDTCCIDKRNFVELSEAINSMYKWYKQSQFCVAYLFDVDHTPEGQSWTVAQTREFQASSWFARSWTLQELIAPSEIFFYDKRWTLIGSKSRLRAEIAQCTLIDEDTLAGADPTRCSVARRMSWAAKREATRVEDKSYSLLGLFDISLPMLYGEGERAFMSLQKAIISSSEDQNIFSWNIGDDKDEAGKHQERTYYGLLAKSPAAFASCSAVDTIPANMVNRKHKFMSTPLGIELHLPRILYGSNVSMCVLQCTNKEDGPDTRCAIYVEQLEDEEEYARIQLDSESVFSITLKFLMDQDSGESLKTHICQVPKHDPIRMVHGFYVDSVSLPSCSPEDINGTMIWSLVGGTSTLSSRPPIIQMPRHTFGFPILILLPPEFTERLKSRLTSIWFLFNTRLRPSCMIMSNSKEEEIHPTIRRQGLYDRHKHPIRSNREMPLEVYTGFRDMDEIAVPMMESADTSRDEVQQEIREMLRRLNFCAFTGDRKQPSRIVLEDEKITISFRLQRCPENLENTIEFASGPRPWDLWTVSISKLGDFDDDVSVTQSGDGQADREDRGSWIKRAMAMFMFMFIAILGLIFARRDTNGESQRPEDE